MDEQQLSNLKNELSKIRDNIGQVYSQDSNNQTKEEISNELQSSWRKFKELLQDAPIENKDILLDELGADFFNGLSDRCVTDRVDNFIMILEGYISGIQTHLNEKDYDGNCSYFNCLCRPLGFIPSFGEIVYREK